MKSSLGLAVSSSRAVCSVLLPACLVASLTARAANDYWAGAPGVGATTNWSDSANWTYANQSSPQTYYNQVEFLGPGANANNNFAINNVLDNIASPGIAQMPIWELDYDLTNGNYTTLIDPGITMQIAAGNGNLKVGADILNTGSPAPANAVETITIEGPGAALSVSGNLFVGQGSVTPNDTHNVTLDLSGLDNFAMTANNNYIYLASSAAARANGVLYLAKTNNIVLGNGIQMGNQASSSNSQPIALYLGINNSITLGSSGNFNIGQTGVSTNGAIVEFNPAFLGGATPPTATFNSSASGGRINNLYVDNISQSFPSYALCNLSGGSVNVLLSTLEVGASSSGIGAVDGVLTFDMGTINANGAYVGRQQSSGGGMAVGTVNINSNSTYSANATLIVGGTLSIAGTSGTVTPGTAGTINLNGGALSAGVITNGGGTGAINATNGAITITGNAGTLAAPISNLKLSGSSLTVAVTSVTNAPVVAGSLATGSGNVINVSSVPPSASYPVQMTLVKYSGTLGGAGFNFTLGTLPSLCAGYLSNNVANASVDLVLTTGPAFLTWTGAASDNWDTTSANWLAGSIDLYSDGDFVKFLDGANTGTVNLTAIFSPGGITASNNALTYTFTGSGSIGGGGVLLKEGAGTFIVDNTGGNTYSGGTIISNGVLQVGNGDTSGNLPGAVADYGVLAYDRTDTSGLGIGNTISGSGGFVQAGAGGTLQLSGANTFTGPVGVTNGSTLQLGSSLALGGGTNKTTIVANGSTLDINGYTAGGTVMVSGTGVSGNGALTDTGYSVYDNPGPGFATNITLTGDTTFYYPTRWDMGSTAGGNVISTLGQPYNLTLNAASSSAYYEWRNLTLDPALANITIESGQLGVVGTTSFGNPADSLVLTPNGQLVIYGASVYVNKAVDFQNGATINNASGANTMNGAMTLESGAYCTFNVGGGTTLTLSNNLTGTGTFAQEGGTGTTVLDGNSPTFTGSLFVYGGQLTLNGLIGSGVTAYSGTTFAGAGTANGLVDVGGAFYPGGQSSAGTFTAAGGLTLESTAALTMDLAPTTGIGGGTNDLIAVTGNLTVNGNNITLNPLTGTLASGTYVLMTYSGTLTGSFGTASLPTGSRYAFTIDTSTPHEVKLDVVGNPNLLDWNNGSGDGQWNVQSSPNWTNLTTHAEDEFYSADVVLLDNSIQTAANPNTTLTINSVVQPSMITNNSSTNYVISGGGQIGGGASLVKLGTSTLTINTTNNFTGNILIAGGVVQVNGEMLPTASGLGATNGTLTITNSTELVVNEQGGYPAGDSGFGARTVVVSGSGANAQGAIQNNGNAIYSDGTSPGFGSNIKLAGNTTIGGTSRWDWGDQANPQYLSTGGSNYNFTAIESGYAQWFEVMIDTNLGNIDYYTTAGSRQTWAVHGFGSSLGNPTNILTLHSNVLMSIGHSDFGNYDSGYAKVIHVVPTAAYEYAPGGGNGDYRLATSFILDDGSEFDFFNGTGGSGSGTAVSGALVLSGLVHFQIGDSTVTFSNVISGTGGFYWDNYNNTLAFAATNTYQGITDIRSGLTLALIGNGSIADSYEISLASGAALNVNGRGDQTLTLGSGQTLLGSGQVGGNLAVAAGSTVAPGTTNTTGTLTVTNNATLAGNALFKLNNTANDALAVNGALTYGGTLTLTNISATPLAAGNSFKLFNAGSYSGSFAGLSPASPGAGLAWNTSALSSSGTISIVSTSGPTISSITVAGGNVIINGTNGSSGSYDVLSTTNLTVPLTNWTVVTSGTFGSGGGFSTTNAVGTGSQKFYILRVP